MDECDGRRAENIKIKLRSTRSGKGRFVEFESFELESAQDSKFVDKASLRESKFIHFLA